MNAYTKEMYELLARIYVEEGAALRPDTCSSVLELLAKVQKEAKFMSAHTSVIRVLEYINTNKDRLVGGYNVQCTKCKKSFSSSQDYHTHTQVGYPCGPKAR